MRSRTPSSNRTEREQILSLLADTIETTHDRIDALEGESLEEQELQIKWIRAQGYLAGQYRKLLNDEELDELEAELDLVKHVTGLEDD